MRKENEMGNVLITTYSIREIEDICELVSGFDDGKKQIAVFTKEDPDMPKFQNLIIHIESMVQYEELVKRMEEVYLSPTLVRLDKEIFKTMVRFIVNENKQIVDKNMKNICNYHHAKFDVCIDNIIEKLIKNGEVVII